MDNLFEYLSIPKEKFQLIVIGLIDSKWKSTNLNNGEPISNKTYTIEIQQ